MKKDSLILEFQFLSSLMDSLTQQKVANAQRLRDNPQDINALSLEEKLKNDKEIILPKLKEVYRQIMEHYKSEGKEFKFL